MTLFSCTTDQFQVLSICINFGRSYVPLGTKNTGNKEFSALFFYMLWHIKLKFKIWLYLFVLQIKFDCHQFSTIFVEVMPIMEHRILEIDSFPHFSPTCFWHILLKLCIWPYFICLRSSSSVVVLCIFFVGFISLRSSSSVVVLRIFFVGFMPLLELGILEMHSFPYFSPSCLDTRSWNFVYDFPFMSYSENQVESCSFG